MEASSSCCSGSSRESRHPRAPSCWKRFLGRGKIRSVLWASAIGTPLPSAPAAFLPTALGLARRRAPAPRSPSSSPHGRSGSTRSLSYALMDPIMTVASARRGVRDRHDGRHRHDFLGSGPACGRGDRQRPSTAEIPEAPEPAPELHPPFDAQRRGPPRRSRAACRRSSVWLPRSARRDRALARARRGPRCAGGCCFRVGIERYFCGGFLTMLRCSSSDPDLHVRLSLDPPSRPPSFSRAEPGRRAGVPASGPATTSAHRRAAEILGVRM